MSTTSSTDANAILMGGGGATRAKFAEPGDTVKGRVVAPPTAYQEREYVKDNPGGGDLKTYPSGDPIMSLYVDLATDLHDPNIQDDDGVRRVYIEGRYLKADVRAAVAAAGAKGLEVGGVLQLSFTHREDPMDKRSRKFWQASYTPAGNAALMGAEPPAQPAPVQPAAVPQPTPAPVQQPAAPTPQPTPAPTPAAAAAPAQDPKVRINGMRALGMSDDQIAAALGVDAGVVAFLAAS